MRNMDIITVPGEASVGLSEVPASAPPIINAAAYAAAASTDILTWAGTAPLYMGVAISLSGNTATGLSNGIVYYPINITATTFQVSLTPFGSVINITGDGTGTFTTYQYGDQRGIHGEAPISYYVDRSGYFGGINGIYLVDGSNYVWFLTSGAISSVPVNSLLFLGNIGGIATTTNPTGIAVWNGFLLLFGSTRIDYLNINTFESTGPAAAWVYSWSFTGSYSPGSVLGYIPLIIAQEDGQLIFTSTAGLGSLVLSVNSSTGMDYVFDPTNPLTYTLTSSAVPLPLSDQSTCLAELGGSIIVGGKLAYLYVWDKVSPQFNDLLNVPDMFTTYIIATSQVAYVFAGNRGRIFVTNGSGIDLYKKVPDYLTGVLNPYIVWIDASFGKNQLYFSFAARSNGGTVQTTVSGAWAVNLDDDALRMENKTTDAAYAGITNMVVEMPSAGSSPFVNPQGTPLVLGWYDGTTYGVDVGSSNPYSDYESYIETDMLPLGTFLDPFTPTQVEWKVSAPLVAGESVRLSYRTSLGGNYAPITDSTHPTGESSVVGSVSDMIQTNFQKAQWVQLKMETKSTDTNPSFVRLTEVRIRDYPSGQQSEVTLPVSI